MCPLFPPDLEDDGPAAAAAAFPLGPTAAGGITGTPLPRRAAGGGMATAIGGGGGFCSISISLFTRTVPNSIGAGGAVPERPAAEGAAAADTDAAATADAGRAGGAIGLGKSRWSLLEEALPTSSALLEAALSSFKFVTAAAAGSATWWLQPATGSQSA